MKYTPTTEFRGGAFLGYVEDRVPYSVLVKLFGEPGKSDGYKVAFEWVIDFEDGLFARIYDWKETTLYDLGRARPSEIQNDQYVPEWHIGGDNDAVVARVNQIIKEKLRG